MNLIQVVHRLATDSSFAMQLEEESAARSSNIGGLDQDSFEAFQAVLRGPQSWQELCNPSFQGMEGYWEPSSCAAEERQSQALALSYDQMLEQLCAPQPATELSLRTLPALCCAALNLPQPQTQQLAAAWNTLYTALHLLDNIEDGDEPNRVQAAWGTGPTLNFTTGLLASIGLKLDGLYDQGVAPQTIRALQREFNRTLLAMCSGQHHDLTLAEPTLEQCWSIADAKSSIFFALAGRAAALLAGGDARRTQQLEAFGQHLGLLVQITDDISGLWSWSHAHSDLGAGSRWTLPVAYAMSVLDADQQARLRALLSDASSPTAEAEARQIVIASGALLYMATQAQRHYHAALRLLEQLSMSAATSTALRELLHQAAPRTINQTSSPVVSSSAAQPARAETPLLSRTTLFATTA